MKEESKTKGALIRLQNARKHIARKDGFTKGQLEDENGAVCMLGALEYAGCDTDDGPERKLLRMVLPKGLDVPDYNDKEKTTQKMVVAMFDKAIQKAKVIAPLHEKLEKLGNPFSCDC